MKRVLITVTENTPDEVYARICRGFEESEGKELSFEKAVDNSLLGGFTAEIDGEIFDMSVSAQLREMRKKIGVEL